MKIVMTGTSTGIGKVLSEQLINEGHQICKISRSPQSGYSYACDVSDINAIKNCVTDIENKWNYIDALICCAGIQFPIQKSMVCNPTDWIKNIEVNLHGTYYTIHSFYPLLVKSLTRPKIICFSGGGSTNVRPYFSSYSVSKIGIVKLTETIASEYINLDINSIAPGAFYTNMSKEILQSDVLKSTEEFDNINKMPIDNTKKHENLLNLINFLISSQSDGISGKLLSAQWDPIDKIKQSKNDKNLFTLRRVI